MPTKQELYQIIQNYRALNCPKLNINSSKKDLQIAVVRIQNNMKFTSNTKTEAKTQTTKPKEATKKNIDDIQKEIDSLRKKAGKIAEKKGRVTTEVKKLLETINVKARERLRLIKEMKSKK